MRPTFSAFTALLATLPFANGQTSTSCNPTIRDCPADPALGKTFKTDFTKPITSDWTVAASTTVSHDENGVNFVVRTPNDAPTIASTKYIFFGKVQAVVRAAPGAGIVSSVILQSDDLDEIDLEWIGSQDNAVQTNFFGKGNTTTYDRGGTTAVTKPVEDWYEYTIEWTNEAITWYVNGTLIRTVTYDDPHALGGKNYPQTPMRVKIGNWVACPDQDAASNPATAGTCSWAGGPADWSHAPYTMMVKSVTVQDYGCASQYEYGDRSGSWQSIKSIGGCGGGNTHTSVSTKSEQTSATSVHHTTTSATTTDATRSAPNHDKPTSTSDSTTDSTSHTQPTSSVSTSISGSSNGQSTPTVTSTGSFTSSAPYNTGNSTSTGSGGPVSYSSGAYTGTGTTGIGGTGTGSPTTFASSTSNNVSPTSSSSGQTISPTIAPGAATNLHSPRILELSVLALCVALGFFML